MNKKIRIISIGVALFSLMQFWSCNDYRLSKNEAESKIKEYMNTKINKSVNEDIHAVVRKWIGEQIDNQFEVESSEIKPYLEAGLLSINNKDYRQDTHKIWYIYKLTEKGNPYLIRESKNEGNYPIFTVKLFDIEFDDITGIKEITPNEFSVEFTIKKVNKTPFEELKEKQKDTSTLIAEFQKYDDGWRLIKIVEN